jgi:hypothetical protein
MVHRATLSLFSFTCSRFQENFAMASAPANDLPLFYKELQPLSSQLHKNWKARNSASAAFFAQSHVVPLTVDEFANAQRHYPIVFSVGPNPVPLALLGLNEGVNVFTDDEGVPRGNMYVPAYVRRYPFMLAKLNPQAQELSLCFDPTADVIGDYEDGEPLFDGDQPGPAVKATLDFCEKFEEAGARTGFFVNELVQNKLLIDGEFTIQPNDGGQPFIYRGFQIIAEERLHELRGDVLRKFMQNGVLPLAFAHIFSLQAITEIFSMQMQQGKVPTPNLVLPA